MGPLQHPFDQTTDQAQKQDQENMFTWWNAATYFNRNYNKYYVAYQIL